MKTKHTPGPWKILGKIVARGKIDQIDVGFDGYTVARISCYGDLSENNAHLIAAAPEMLEALERIVDYFQRQTLQYKTRDWAYHNGPIQNAKNAIAKAKGE